MQRECAGRSNDEAEEDGVSNGDEGEDGNCDDDERGDNNGTRLEATVDLKIRGGDASRSGRKRRRCRIGPGKLQ